MCGNDVLIDFFGVGKRSYTFLH